MTSAARVGHEEQQCRGAGRPEGSVAVVLDLFGEHDRRPWCSPVVKTDFSAKGPHFSAKRKIFPLTVKDAERALFARIQLGRSWAGYPGRPRAFYGEPHVVTV